MHRDSDMNVTSCSLFDGKIARQTVLPAHQVAKKLIAMMVLLFASSQLTSCSLLQKFGILSAPAAPAVQAPPPLSAQPYQLNIRLSASADLNPDAQSRPSPVQVRIFVTQAQSELSDRGFEEIFDFAGNSSEPRPLSTMTIRPGQTKNLALSANKSQSLVVVAAAYRDPFQTQWKAIASVTPQDAVYLSAILSANAVTIKPRP